MHGDVGHPEKTGHLVGLQGCWSATYFLVGGPDSRNVVANATCGRETASEVGDIQAQSGDVWIKEAEVVVITELDEGLCLQGVVSGGTWGEGMSSEVLGRLLELR